MSRLSAIYDDANDDGDIDAGEDVYSSFKYLGAGKIVEEDYQDIEVKLSYLDGSGNVTGLDRFGRIAEQLWTDYGASQTIDDYTYTYDRMGNRLTRGNTQHTAFNETYTYDALNRLTAWSVGGTQQKTWSYDSLGNDRSSGTYNAANEETPNAGSSGYDAAGNMTTLKSGKTAKYDAWNRLVEVDDGATVVEKNEYDGTGRRVQIFSNYSGSTPGTTIDEYHNGQQTIETRENGSVKYQTIWSPRYIDSPILRDTYSGGVLQTAQRVFYLADANYNVTGLMKYDSGAGDWTVAERYTYTPYGVVTYRNADWTTAGSSANLNTTLYTGRTLDLLTSLYYYRARFYDATLERFINRDPMQYEPGDFNLYRYVHNNPVVLTDPSGLWPWSITYVPVPPNANSIVCRGGRLEIQNNNHGADSVCTQIHEASHLTDWIARYGNSICTGKPDGTQPVGGWGYEEFRRKSECAAYQIGYKCRVSRLGNCNLTDAEKDEIRRGMQRDTEQMRAEKCWQ